MGVTDQLPYTLFFGSGPDRAVLKKAWPIIDRHLDKILDDFYGHIFASPLGPILEKVDMVALRQKQRLHWRVVILEDFGVRYQQRVERMHAKHITIGLPSTFYVLSCLFILREFRQAILTDADGLDDARIMLDAVDTVIAIDVSTAFALYYDAIDGDAILAEHHRQ